MISDLLKLSDKRGITGMKNLVIFLKLRLNGFWDKFAQNFQGIEY